MDSGSQSATYVTYIVWYLSQKESCVWSNPIYWVKSDIVAIRKPSFFRTLSKREGSSTGIHKFWGSLVFPYFCLLLDNKWGEMRGSWPFFKSYEALYAQILGKSLSFWPVQKLPHGCPKWTDTKVTSGMSKIRGGGRWRPLLDNVQKKDIFYGFPEPVSMVLLSHLVWCFI